jgi:hypothetical protein
MRGAPLLLAAALLAACDRSPRPAGDSATAAAPAGDELPLSPSGEGSLITPATTAADLVRRFGAASVRDGEIPLAEGDGTAGTILFPDDTTRRAEIVWRDAAARARPDFVRVGSTARRWTLAPGIRIGTTLPELERLNGGPFMVAGFDAGDDAFVSSWRGGRLDSAFAGRMRPAVTLALDDPAESRVSADERNRVVGSDSAVRSDDPVLRRLNPRVVEIVVAFHDPGTAVEDRATSGALMAADALRRMPVEGRAPRDFVPPHWRVFSEASGDLNGDGAEDHAMTVTPDENDAANRSVQEGEDWFPPDIVVVLLAEPGGRLRRVGANSRLSPRIPDARPHAMEIKEGELSLHANFGNNEATDITYRFRWDRAAGALLLAGYEVETYTRSGSGDARRVREDYAAGTREESERYGERTKASEGERPDPPPRRTTIPRYRVPFEEVRYADDAADETPLPRPFKPRGAPR